MFSNKKAVGESTLGKIILVALLVLIIAYFLYFFFIKNFVEKTITECDNAYCKEECDFATEYMDATKICTNNEKQVCCKPINPATNPLSAECSGKKEGDYCAGTYRNGNNIPKVCTKDLKCVELCEYCTTHPTYDKCKFTPDKVIGIKITSFTNGFGCGCSISECPTNLNTHTCLKGFCSTTDTGSGSYYCCNK
mgnify:CR=1 FL=1